jgi:hypothetical protein
MTRAQKSIFLRSFPEDSDKAKSPRGEWHREQGLPSCCWPFKKKKKMQLRIQTRNSGDISIFWQAAWWVIDNRLSRK